MSFQKDKAQVSLVNKSIKSTRQRLTKQKCFCNCDVKKEMPADKKKKKMTLGMMLGQKSSTRSSRKKCNSSSNKTQTKNTDNIHSTHIVDENSRKKGNGSSNKTQTKNTDHIQSTHILDENSRKKGNGSSNKTQTKNTDHIQSTHILDENSRKKGNSTSNKTQTKNTDNIQATHILDACSSPSSDADLIVISEADSCISDKVSPHSDLSDTVPMKINYSNFELMIEDKDCANDLNPSLHSTHLRPKYNRIPNQHNKFTNFETDFSAQNTLPGIEINSNFGSLMESNKTLNTIQNSELHKGKIFEGNSPVSDTGQVAVKDNSALNDITHFNNGLSPKRSFMLLINRLNSVVDAKESFICNQLEIQPLIKPPEFNYDQNNAFGIAVDISMLKAASSYIKENTSGDFPEITDSLLENFWENSVVNTSDLSLNFSDIHHCSSEDAESEVSISSYKTSDILTDFFDVHFPENPENITENFSLDKLTPDELCYSDLNVGAIETCSSNPEVSAPQTEDVINDLIDQIPAKLTSKPKKKRKRSKWYPRKRCRKRNNNIASKLDNELNAEILCDTCDESEGEEVISGSLSSNCPIDIEKCENVEITPKVIAVSSTPMIHFVSKVPPEAEYRKKSDRLFKKKAGDSLKLHNDENFCNTGNADNLKELDSCIPKDSSNVEKCKTAKNISEPRAASPADEIDSLVGDQLRNINQKKEKYKKEKSRQYPKKSKDSGIKLGNELSEENPCNNSEENGLQEPLMDLQYFKDPSNVEKCKGVKQISESSASLASIIDPINSRQFRNVKQRRGKSSTINKTKKNKEIVSNLLNDDITSDIEELTKDDDKKNGSKNIIDSCMNEGVVEKSNDELNDKNNVFQVHCSDSSSNIQGTNSSVSLSRKKRNKQTPGNIKCSFDLNILSDKFGDNQSFENAVDGNVSNLKGKCDSSLNPDNFIQPDYSKETEETVVANEQQNVNLDRRKLIVKILRVEEDSAWKYSFFRACNIKQTIPLEIVSDSSPNSFKSSEHLTNLDYISVENNLTEQMEKDNSPTLLEQITESSYKTAHETCVCNSGDITSKCICVKKLPIKLIPKETSDIVISDKAFEPPSSVSSGFCSSVVSKEKDNCISNIQPVIVDNELDVNTDDSQFQNGNSEISQYRQSPSTENNISSSPNQKKNAIQISVDVHSSCSNAESDFKDLKHRSNNKIPRPVKTSKKGSLQSSKKHGSCVSVSNAISQDCINSEVVSPSKSLTSESKNTAKSPKVQDQNVIVESDFNDVEHCSNNTIPSPVKTSKKDILRSYKKNGSCLSVPNASSRDSVILNSEVVSPSKSLTSELKNAAKSSKVQDQMITVENITNLRNKKSAHFAEACSEVIKASSHMKPTCGNSKTIPTEIKSCVSESDANLENPENLSNQSTELKSAATKICRAVKASSNEKCNVSSTKRRKLNDHLETSNSLLPEVDAQNLKNMNSESHLLPKSKKYKSNFPSKLSDYENATSVGNKLDTQAHKIKSLASQGHSENFASSSKISSPSNLPIAKSKNLAKSVKNKVVESPVIVCIKDDVCSLVSENNSEGLKDFETILTSSSTSRKTRRVLQSKAVSKKQDILSIDNNASIDKINTVLSSQTADCTEEIISSEKCVTVSNIQQVNSEQEVESFHKNQDLVITNNLSIQEATLSIEDTVLLLENTNIHKSSETESVSQRHLEVCQIPISDDISAQKLSKNLVSSIGNKKINLLKKNSSSNFTKSNEVSIKGIKIKDSRDCKSKNSVKNNVKPKIMNKFSKKSLLSKSNKCKSQILSSNISENFGSPNVDSDLNNESISTEIVQQSKEIIPHVQNETEGRVNQNKQLQEELTAQKNSYIGTNSSNLFPKISNSELKSDSSDALSLMDEDDLDFEPDQIDEPSNFILPKEDACHSGNDYVLKSPTKQLDINLDKTVGSDLHTSDNNMDYENDEVLSICDPNDKNPFEHLISNYQTYPSEQYLPSEDDSDSDDEHSFKRTRYETKNNIIGKPLSSGFTLRSNESCSQNSDGSSKNIASQIDSCNSSSEDQHASFSKGDASDSSSHLKASHPIRHLNDVVEKIKECCVTKSFEEAIKVARTYIEISCSSDVNKVLVKKLLSSLFSSFLHSNDFSDVKIFEEVKGLMQDFNLHDKQISSYFIVKCCAHPNLNIYAIHMFHICRQKSIPLNTEAINTYGSLLKSEYVTLPVLLDYLYFIRSVCNKRPSKDLTHLALKKSSEKNANLSDIHHMCSYLHRVTPKEIDDLVLINFLELCFAKCMWLYVAEMFMKWGTKNRLTLCLYQALIKNAETMGKYFSKFADAVHGKEESIHPELRVIFGQIGTALMLNAFKKNSLQTALKILDTLHVYNVNYFEAQLDYESSPNANTVTKVFPFFVIFSSIDICLDNNRPKHAFTIFQDFSWINSTENLNETEKAYVQKEKYHRLLKLIPLLNNTESLNEGWEALKILLSEIEQDSFKGILGDNKTKLCAIYNKYLVSLLNSGKISSAHDLYQHSLGRKKDIFLLRPVVLRGLVVAFSQHKMPKTAKDLFMLGIMKDVYSIKKPEPDSFPWNITILSNWTTVEIQFAIDWFIGTLFPLLMDKPQDTNFEKWFSFKVNFKVIEDDSVKNRLKIDCLLDTESDPKSYIRKTKDVLQSMDPSLEFSDETDESALCITSASLYNYWINMYSGAPLKFPSNGAPLLISKKRRLSFGIKTSSSTEEATSLQLPLDEKKGTNIVTPTKQPGTSAESLVEWIGEIRASTSTCSYSPVSPEHCPPFILPNTVNSTSRSCIIPVNGTSLFNPKLSDHNMEASTSNALMNVNFSHKSPIKGALITEKVHYESYNSPKKSGNLNNNTLGSFSGFDNDQTLKSSSQTSNPKLTNSPQNKNNSNAMHFNDVKENGAVKQVRNATDLRKTSSQKISTHKVITGTPGSSKSAQGTLLNIHRRALARSSSIQSLNKLKNSKRNKLSVNSSSLKSNSVIKKTRKRTNSKKSLSNKIKNKKFENFTVCVSNNSTARTVSNTIPRTSLAEQDDIETNTKSLSKNEEHNDPQFCCKIPVPDTKMPAEPAKFNVQKQNQDLKETIIVSQKGSRTAFQKQTTDSVPKKTIINTNMLNKVSQNIHNQGIVNIQNPNVKNNQPKFSKPVINRNFTNNVNTDAISDAHKLKVVSDSAVASSSGASHTQLMFDKKEGRNEHLKVEFKSVFTESAKPTNFVSVSTCTEDFKEISKFLERKQALKHKNLSQEQQRGEAMRLAELFVRKYEVTKLDKKTMKQLSEFANCNI